MTTAILTLLVACALSLQRETYPSDVVAMGAALRSKSPRIFSSTPLHSLWRAAATNSSSLNEYTEDEGGMVWKRFAAAAAPEDDRITLLVSRRSPHLKGSSAACSAFPFRKQATRLERVPSTEWPPLRETLDNGETWRPRPIGRLPPVAAGGGVNYAFAPTVKGALAWARKADKGGYRAYSSASLLQVRRDARGELRASGATRLAADVTPFSMLLGRALITAENVNVADASLPVVQGNVWLGTAGCVTPFHYDGRPNLLVGLRGTKRVTLLPPHAMLRPSLALYPSLSPYPRQVAADASSVPASSSADGRGGGGEMQLCRSAVFAGLRSRTHADAIDVTLRAGEALLIPSHWLHRVVTLAGEVGVKESNGRRRGNSTSLSLSFWMEGVAARAARALARSALLRAPPSSQRSSHGSAGAARCIAGDQTCIAATAAAPPWSVRERLSAARALIVAVEAAVFPVDERNPLTLALVGVSSTTHTGELQDALGVPTVDAYPVRASVEALEEVAPKFSEEQLRRLAAPRSRIISKLLRGQYRSAFPRRFSSDGGGGRRARKAHALLCGVDPTHSAIEALWFGPRLGERSQFKFATAHALRVAVDELLAPAAAEAKAIFGAVGSKAVAVVELTAWAERLLGEWVFADGTGNAAIDEGLRNAIPLVVARCL